MKRKLITVAAAIICVLFVYRGPYANANHDFDHMFKNHGAIMMLLEVESGNIVYVNQSAADFYGYTIDELLNMNISQINMLPIDKIETERKAAAREERNYFIFPHRLAGGEIRTVEVYSWPVYDNTILFSVIHDITWRVEADKSIIDLNEKMKLAELKSSVGHWEFHLSENKVTSSPGAQRIYGIEGEDFSIPAVQNIPLPQYRDILDQALKNLVEESIPYEVEFSIRRLSDGQIRHIQSLAEYDPVRNVVFGVIVDITDLKNAQRWVINQKNFIIISLGIFLFIQSALIILLVKTRKNMSRDKERFKTTLLSVGDGIISADRNGNITIINEEAEKLTGWNSEEALGKPFNEVFVISDEKTKKIYDDPIKRIVESVKSNNTVLLSKDQTEKVISYSVSVIKGEKTNAGIVVAFKDMTQEYNKKRQIEFLSFYDQLTGLYNRRFFEEELNRLNTKRNLPLAIIMADLNGLKLTNDAFGHQAGDTILKKTAETMKNILRSDDIIARLGGDEFVILIPKISDEEVEKIVQRIKHDVENIKINSMITSVSIGWETKKDENEDIYEIMKKAEDYMYKKKLFESPSMRGKTIESIINTLHEKSIREKMHSERVSQLCMEIGKAMDLNEKLISDLRAVGLLHDIGKIAIDEGILTKTGKLSKDELEEIRRHPEIGYRILSTVNDLAEMAEYVLAHHERIDGNGYPKKLKGNKIPVPAKIIAVADSYDAMISYRPYRTPLTEEEAIKELINNSGTQFDGEIVKIFIEKVLKKGKI